MIIDQCLSMDRIKTAFDDLDIENGGRMDKRKHVDEDHDDVDEEDKFKSKNLKAERTRRKKLNDRQLKLRSMVPVITNMNKATIITDAITYIEQLQENVEHLKSQLREMEVTNFHAEGKSKFEEADAGKDLMDWGIKPEVEVNHIDGTKLWIKIVCPKKRGVLTKMIEAMNVLGFDLTDTSITTSRGALLFTSSIGVADDGAPDAHHLKKFLSEFIGTSKEVIIKDCSMR